MRRVLRAAERERLVAANDSDAIDAEDTRERDPVCSSRIALICFESFSRVDNASWMQSSRLESRIRASNEEVGWIDGVMDRKGLEGGARDSLRGRSVKLVYMPSERWSSMQFGGRGWRKFSSYTLINVCLAIKFFASNLFIPFCQ